ncbi:WxL domain-containing protein [Lacticaseibacillus suihuaensis]
MRKQGLIGAIALAAALAAAPLTTSRAAESGPGTSDVNLDNAGVSGGFEVDANGKAAANSTASFKLEAGVLELDAVPNFDFGTANVEDIATGNKLVLKNVDNTSVKAADAAFDGNDEGRIVVQDFRGNNAGWNLTAQTGTKFAGSTADMSIEMSSFEMFISKDTTTADKALASSFESQNIAGASASIVNAAAGNGAGRSDFSLSEATVQLVQQLKVQAGDYNAVVNWTLANAPDPE